MRAAAAMQVIEGLTDAEIAEAERSELIFEEVWEMTAPLDAFLSFIHAIDWLDPKAREDKAALHAFFDGQFGDPVQIALGSEPVMNGRAEAVRFSELLAKSRELIEEEHFLSWQVAFPGVWSIWESAKLTGGFDAIIGNPPWDRIKLQQVEWFAARRRDIAMAQKAADRKRMVANLQANGDPLARDYAKAEALAEAAFRMARGSGDYPLLSRRRHEHILAVRRAGDGARQAGWHSRPSDPFRHRVRQDRRPILQGRINRRSAEGALRL